MASILIIDDDPVIQVLLREMLVQDQHRVFVAGDGVEGLKVCGRESLDLVILDILMARKDGFETLKDIKTNYRTLMVMAISGGLSRGGLNLLDMAKAFGAHRTMWKPLEAERVRTMVNGLLSERADIER